MCIRDRLNILQGSVDYIQVDYKSSTCKFSVVYTCKKYENWLSIDEVIAMQKLCSFYGLLDTSAPYRERDVTE